MAVRVSCLLRLLLIRSQIGNAFVTTLPSYVVLRFIAGFGLAGEIGAGVTVSELLPKERRGIGVTIVATVGVAGAIAAAYVGSHLTWRNGYLLGGVMGLGLLALRVLVHESGMYKQMENTQGVRRGSLRLLFSSKERVGRFLACIAIGIPIWLVFGLYGVFAPELAKAFGLSDSYSRADGALLRLDWYHRRRSCLWGSQSAPSK